MELLLQTDPAAKAVVFAVVLYAVLGEAAVTYAATTHDAAAAPSGRLAEAARAVTTTA